MAVRGIRGATTVRENTKDEIALRTEELLKIMLKQNGVMVGDIASAVFSVTDDVNSEFPAVAARRLGWIYTPLLCTREIPVPGSLQGCIRVLLHVNSERPQDQVKHVYLHEAKKLRPDLDTKDDNKYYISEDR